MFCKIEIPFWSSPISDTIKLTTNAFERDRVSEASSGTLFRSEIADFAVEYPFCFYLDFRKLAIRRTGFITRHCWKKIL